MRLGTAVIFLMSCAPINYTHHYTVTCFNVDSEIPLNQERMDSSISIAAGMVDEFFKSPGLFCSSMSDVYVKVHPVPWHNSPRLQCTENTCMGYYDLVTGMDLDYSGAAIVHEFLHLEDLSHLKFGTAWHEGWHTNGYYDLINAFMLKVRPSYDWGDYSGDP